MSSAIALMPPSRKMGCRRYSSKEHLVSTAIVSSMLSGMF
jgi:hypothetical protein